MFTNHTLRFSPDVSSGLEIEGENASPDSDAAFNASVAASVAKSKAETAPVTTTEAKVDPATDSAESIQRSVLADGPNMPNLIESGLTVDTGEPRPKSTAELRESALADLRRAQSNDPGHEAFLRRQQAERESVDAGREAQIELAERDLDSDLYEIDPLSALKAYRTRLEAAGLPEQDVETLLEVETTRAAYAFHGLDPDDDDLEEFAEEISGTWTEWENELKQAKAVEKIQQTMAGVEATAQQLAKTHVLGQEAALKAHFKAQGVRSDDEANGRLADINELAAQSGIDLDRLTAEQGLGAYRSTVAELDAWVVEAKRTQRQDAFHRQLLDTEDTNVADGLEVFTPFGWARLNGGSDDLPEPQLDHGRIAAHVQRRVTRAEDIRRSVAAPEATSVAHGLTGPDGKRIDIDDATGQRRRLQQERKDRIAQSLVGLPGGQ